MVLLLSASIRPSSIASNGKRLDPVERENDYIAATSFYLSRGFSVVLVDNSGYVSEKLSSLKLNYLNFEYLVFNTTQSYLGKAKGEIEIINYALKFSELLSEVNYLVKITGRYIIKNINDILCKVDFKENSVYINPTRNLKWADTRLMMMSKEYYNVYFLPAVRFSDEKDKNYYMEVYFMKSLFLFLLDGGNMNLWPTYPFYQGMDGTHNEKVFFGFFKSLKYSIYYKLKKFIFKHRA